MRIIELQFAEFLSEKVTGISAVFHVCNHILNS